MGTDARYSTPEAAEIIGMNYRTLDELIRQGIVRPTRGAQGRGSSRGWSLADLVGVRIGLEWSQKGLDWRSIAKVVQFIGRNGLEAVEANPYIAIVPGGRAKALPKDTAIGELAGAAILLSDLRPAIATMRKRAERIAPSDDNRTPKRRRKVAATTR